MLGRVNMSRRMPHAVIFPHAAQGHITPMIQLAKLLASHGFKITFVNTTYMSSRLLAAQKSAVEEVLDITFEGLDDGLPDDHPRTNNIPLLVAAIEKLEQPFAQLIESINKRENEKVAGSPVSCIISDIVHSHTQDLADRLGIKRIAFWTPSACAVSSYMHAPLLVERGIIPISKECSAKEQVIVDCIPGLYPIRSGELPSFLIEEGPMLERMIRHGQPVIRASWVLINTFYELEQDVIDGLLRMLPQTIPIGPLLLYSFLNGSNGGSGIWAEDESCLQWLEKQEPRSVLYISFGSIVKTAAAQLMEIATGLEASRQRFLWVIRTDMQYDESNDWFRDFEERMRNQGRIITWAPQLQVLSHTSVGGFMTHNGWNSTLESICAGVPMLCWPGFAEQFMNARFVVDVWKVGMEFRKNKDGFVSHQEIAKLVLALLSGKEGVQIRAAALKLKESAKASIVQGGSSNGNIEKLIQNLAI